MVTASSSNANNPALALTLLRPAVADAMKVKSEQTSSDHNWLSDLMVAGSDETVDDFIYDPTGKLGPDENTDPVNFWEVAAPAPEAENVVVGTAPIEKPWTQTFSSIEDFKTALQSYLGQKVASPEVQEALRIAAIMTPEKQALQDGVVRDSAPREADDLVRTVAMLNHAIKASGSDRYKENQDYRESVDTITTMFKRIITNDYSYLKGETDVSGPLIVANDDGTYSIPDFTISYKGLALYSHTSISPPDR